MTSIQPLGAWVRPVRLGCGLLLFAYLFTHFANHAFGLVSLHAMEEARLWFLALWRNPIAEALLLGALLAHWLLGLWLIYRRRTLRMPVWEAAQIILGLIVPPLLAYHIVGTRLANAIYGSEDLYTRVILGLWVQNPTVGGLQAGLFTAAWTHGCMGLHYWLRLRAWYGRVFPALFAFFVLMPVLASLGIAEAAREVSVLARQPDLVARLLTETRAPSTAQMAALAQLRNGLVTIAWALLAATLLARIVRERLSRRHMTIRIHYPNGREVPIPVGWTVLEASRSARIPHLSVCGGRGRCSTCRIRVVGDLALTPPAAQELAVLQRIGAGPDVRLACQLRPARDLAVAPLLAPGAVATNRAPRDALGGRERQIAVLFADLRGFTKIAENKLPYDVVFLLNRYFEAVGSAVAEAGGIANQYTGDGVMALFGVSTNIETACRQALLASNVMIRKLEDLSRELENELPSPLRIGVGIHAGSAVVGEIGYGDTHYLTAVGDIVNTASRLEALTKQYGCDLVISELVSELAGLAHIDFPHHDITVRNREAPLGVVIIDEVRRLSDHLAVTGITI
ncbi:MAG: adenylate/guanylate cyclase domain-containing protein [Hyphomicrobiaceae bacterium]|nr:adenylate/guanylate cyclase domain-containing protein [Hyphomicrobiaceae bacterium]